MKINVFGRIIVRKHREIKNGDKYIILDIYHKIDCLEKREFTSSEPKYYMGQPFNGVDTYQTLRTISRTNKKYKASTAIIKVYSQYFMRILEEFKDIPFLRYRKT